MHADHLAPGIVAFANTDGGDVLFGITEKARSPVWKIRIRSAAMWATGPCINCDPPLTVVQEVLRRGVKSVVVVRILKGDQRPYRTNRGVCYVRTSSGRRQASREELLRLFQAGESLLLQ